MRPKSAPPMAYSWLPPKKQKDYEHPASSFSKTGIRPNEYSIHPDWISEDPNAMTPFGRRRFRPWAYEYQGARLAPWGSVEQRVLEEEDTRELLDNDPCPQEANPVTPEYRECFLPRIPIYLTESSPAWKQKTSSTGKPVNHPHNSYSRHIPATTAHGPRDSQRLGDEKYPPPDAVGVYDPVAPNSYREPFTPEERASAMLMSKSATFQPRSGRPRFDRPYMNFANAMWMPNHPREPPLFY